MADLYLEQSPLTLHFPPPQKLRVLNIKRQLIAFQWWQDSEPEWVRKLYV